MKSITFITNGKTRTIYTGAGNIDKTIQLLKLVYKESIQ